MEAALALLYSMEPTARVVRFGCCAVSALPGCLVVERLVVLSRLFHNTFNQKLCDTMMAHLKTALKKLLAESPASPSAALNADLIKMAPAKARAGSRFI